VAFFAGVTTLGAVEGVSVPVELVVTDAATLPEDGAANDGALLAAKEAEEFPIVLVAGGGGAGVVLLCGVVAAAICCRRKRPKETREDREAREAMEMVRDDPPTVCIFYSWNLSDNFVCCRLPRRPMRTS
jgi:hypothetical protein